MDLPQEMKILYLTQILSPSIGGGELLFFNLAKGMVKLGHEVHVICHKKKRSSEIFLPSSEIAKLENLGANVHYVKPEQEDRGSISFNDNFYSAVKMHVGYTINALLVANRISKERKIDIIHANMYTPVIAATLLGKTRHTPVVMTLHNPTIDNWKDWLQQQLIPRSTSVLGPVYEKMILKMPVNVVHVESNKVKEELARINPKVKSVVIYNGVEVHEDLESKSQPYHDIFLLYLGRLFSGKNLEVVIFAFKEVIKSVPLARLLVAGDGPMRQQWEELVNRNNLSKNIIFLGHISDQEAKFELLKKCSAVVFPSTNEGFALVPLEAFEMSKPLLISNVRPSDEIVDDNVDGFLLPPNNPSKWAEKIVYIITNPHISEIMGKKGRRKVIETFNMKVMSAKMEQLYMDIISTPNQSKVLSENL